MVQILDVDGNRHLSYTELRDGMLRLRVRPAIALTEEDFDALSEVHPLQIFESAIYSTNATLEIKTVFV